MKKIILMQRTPAEILLEAAFADMDQRLAELHEVYRLRNLASSDDRDFDGE